MTRIDGAVVFVTGSSRGPGRLTSAEVVADAWDSLEAGASEVLTDELTRRTRATLGLPLADQYPELSGT